ncbi:MAG: 1-(5-phosphoribosyl)-5-[(5-phosphoribosylamino)methylideneamino]imidazole-4-carboxamide isomerase [Fidelibacterota bacterium]|nr:MAG: 1-(5-phosphoribosyl)-5-[(5-phosphoribosylamino)methylideneamino]imidazole-4-carboxamide isomerase [Candidatus Neomarinimicrobiota bacterium]
MERFRVIPAMDLLSGRCARLVQGDYGRRTYYTGDPVDLARAFLDAGLNRLHVVDLDGTKAGQPVNLEQVAKVAATGITVELGGGIRTEEHISQALDSGVEEVILGSSLLVQPGLLQEWLARYGSRLVAGVDTRQGKAAIHGWQTTTDVPAQELISQLEKLGFERLIYTNIATDGTLRGPDLEGLRDVARQTCMEVTAAGGIKSVEDIQAVKALQGLGITGIIVGKAYYEGRITLKELAAC